MSSGVFRIYLLLLCLTLNVKNSGNWERFKKIQKLFNLRCANNLTDTEIEGKLTKRFSKIWAHLTYLSPFPEISGKIYFSVTAKQKMLFYSPMKLCRKLKPEFRISSNWKRPLFIRAQIRVCRVGRLLKNRICPSPTFVKWDSKEVTEILGLNILHRGVTNLFS